MSLKYTHPQFLKLNKYELNHSLDGYPVNIMHLVISEEQMKLKVGRYNLTSIYDYGIETGVKNTYDENGVKYYTFQFLQHMALYSLAIAMPTPHTQLMFLWYRETLSLRDKSR